MGTYARRLIASPSLGIVTKGATITIGAHYPRASLHDEAVTMKQKALIILCLANVCFVWYSARLVSRVPTNNEQRSGRVGGREGECRREASERRSSMLNWKTLLCGQRSASKSRGMALAVHASRSLRALASLVAQICIAFARVQKQYSAIFHRLAKGAAQQKGRKNWPIFRTRCKVEEWVED